MTSDRMFVGVQVIMSLPLLNFVVCGAIYAKAGTELDAACDGLRHEAHEQGRTVPCPVGEAVITKGKLVWNVRYVTVQVREMQQ